jgi:hypothetical protein
MSFAAVLTPPDAASVLLVLYYPAIDDLHSYTPL